MKYVAQSLPHESAEAHVTGAALYTGDLVARFPNLLHAWPVMAPHAHARVLSIDTSAADAIVLTSADVPGEGDSGANRTGQA